MRRILFYLFDKSINGFNLYETEESYWLINPYTNEWAVELEKNGRLWYAIPFFKKSYRLISLNVIDNEKYIVEWVEDLLKYGVRQVNPINFFSSKEVEPILENGILNTEFKLSCRSVLIEIKKNNLNNGGY